MADLSLVFDVLARDRASSELNKVGDTAESTGQRVVKGLGVIAGGLAAIGVTAFVAESIQSLQRIERINAATEAVIRSTGGVAGVTAQHIEDYAGALENATATEAESIQQGANLLATFTNVRNAAGAGNAVFDDTVSIANDMARALDKTGEANLDVSASSLLLGKALNDPIRGIGALTRVGVSFTEQQRDQIAAFVESGDLMGAQKVILAELTKEFGGAGAAFAETTQGKIALAEHALGTFGETILANTLPALADLAEFSADGFNAAAQGFETGQVTAEGFDGAMQQVGVTIADVADGVGTLVDVGGGVVGFFTDLPTPVLGAAAALGALALLRGPVTGAVAAINTGIGNAALAAASAAGQIGAMGSASTVARGAVNGFVSAIGGPLTIAVAGTGLLLPKLVEGIQSITGPSDRAESAASSLAAAIREAGGAINETTRAAAQQSIIDSNLTEVFTAAGVSARDAIDGLLGNADALDRVNDALNAYAATRRTAQQGDEMGEKTRVAINDFEELAEQYRVGAGQAEFFGDAVEGSADQMDAAAPAANTYGDMIAQIGSEATGSAEELQGWLRMVQSANEGFIAPLGIYQELLSQKQEAERTSAQATADATADQSDSWEDYVQDVAVSLSEYAGQLEAQIANQEAWHTNLAIIAQRGGLDVANALAEMGVQGADVTAQMATALPEDFARMATALTTQAQLAGSGATSALATELQVMAAIGTQGAAATVQGIATQLGIGVDQVSEIAARYGVRLSSGMNPILEALGKPQVVITAEMRASNPFYANRRDGGVIDYFADGGLLESHVAEIAPAGDWRVWAEPETGGEAYIPLAPAKRSRSMDIWRETGRRLNAPEVALFAEGGFASVRDIPGPFSTSPFGAPLSTAADAAMRAEFEAAVEVLANQIAGGPAGNGAVGSGWQSIWQYVKARIPQARINSTFRPGDPGYHGRGKAIDFGFGTGPGGAGSAGLAAINRLLHDDLGANLAELIYDGLGDDRPDLKNGRPLTYSGSTQADHRNHVHAATYDDGGLLQPGYTLAFNGTGKNETIRTAEQEADLAMPAARQIVNHFTLDRDADRIARTVVQAQHDDEFLHG